MVQSKFQANSSSRKLNIKKQDIDYFPRPNAPKALSGILTLISKVWKMINLTRFRSIVENILTMRQS